MIGLDIPSLFHWSPEKGFLIFHSSSADAAPDGANWMGWYPWIRQAWSVGAEIWFYLLAPLMVRRRWTVQLAILLASLAIKLAMGAYDISTYYFFPANLWLFLAGSLLFAAYPAIETLGRRWAWPALSAIFLICLTASLVRNPTLFLFDGLPFFALVMWRRAGRRREAWRYMTGRWKLALGGSLASIGSYGIALWAMTQAPVASVAAYMRGPSRRPATR